MISYKRQHPTKDKKKHASRLVSLNEEITDPRNPKYVHPKQKDVDISFTRLKEKDEEIVHRSLENLLNLLPEYYFDVDSESLTFLLKELVNSEDDFVYDSSRKILGYLLGYYSQVSQNLFEMGALYEFFDQFKDDTSLFALSKFSSVCTENRDEVLGFGALDKLVEIIEGGPPYYITFYSICRITRSLLSFPVPDDYLERFSILLQGIIQSQLQFAPEPIFFKMLEQAINEGHFSQNITIRPFYDMFYHIFVDQQDCIDIEKCYISIMRFITAKSNQEGVNLQEEVLPIFNILLSIIENNVVYSVTVAASKLIIRLIQIDVQNFISKNFHKNILNIFPIHFFQVKCYLATSIATAFTYANFEQFNELFQIPDLCKMLFEFLPNVQFDFEYFDLILNGIIKMVDFCDKVKDGKIAFKQLVYENMEFKHWFDSIDDEMSNAGNPKIIEGLTILQKVVNEKVDMYIQLETEN